MKQRNWSKRTRNIVIVLLFLIGVTLISSSFVMLTQYSRNIESQAGFLGLRKASGAAEQLRSSVNVYKNNASLMATVLQEQSYTDVKAFGTAIQRLNTDSRFTETAFVRYFKNNVEYTSAQQIYDKSQESKIILDLVLLRSAGCAGLISDRQYNISVVGFCVPMNNCPYADALAVFYPVESILPSLDSYEEDDLEGSQLSVVCSAEGEVISILQQNKDEYDLQIHNYIYDALRGRINDKSVIDRMQSSVTSGNSDSYTVQISGIEDIIALSSINEHGTAVFTVIGIYHASDLYAIGYSTIGTVLGELTIFFILLIFVAVYIFIAHRRSEKKLQTVNDTNALLKCATRVKFERVADEILSRNKATAFAVVIIDVRHYDYLNNQIGSEQMLKILQHLKLLYSKLLQVDETYGYLNNGRFALLLHYRDENSVAERLKAAALLATSFGTKQAGNVSLSLHGGIYKTELEFAQQATKMIDLAIDAENASELPYDFGAFRFYSETIHQGKEQANYVETHMETALKNRDFKVFYQPKYNIARHEPDGCEALVRWYNPETKNYMQPNVFLPLFEANRFIAKLDRYVYEQVCIYAEESVANNLPLYPVAVNVSRVTAAEKDFLDFYIKTKKKHRIPDGFITIEFSENFTSEDHDMLLGLINTLHQNGFRCAIDDFGTGFASFNTLKELPMDELKMDRIFVDQGLSSDRDMKILSSVIALGRSLNMKVTQEGVETAEQLETLTKLGCNVIQGYFYSTPLAQPDYITFLSQKRNPVI